MENTLGISEEVVSMADSFKQDINYLLEHVDFSSQDTRKQKAFWRVLSNMNIMTIMLENYAEDLNENSIAE